MTGISVNDLASVASILEIGMLSRLTLVAGDELAQAHVPHLSAGFPDAGDRRR